MTNLSEKLEQLSAAATQGEYDSQVQLWFFRELTSDQRLVLFKLCGLPVDEIGHNHSHQRLCLKRVLRRTGQLVVAQADDATVERVAKIAAKAYFARQLDAGYIATPCIGGQDWINVAKAAIAALAAKGDS